MVCLILIFFRGHDALIIGSVEKMWVEIKVDNKRHDAAYPGKVIVAFPPFLGYIGPDGNQVYNL